MPLEENPNKVPHLKVLIRGKKFGDGQRCGSTLSLWNILLKISILFHKLAFKPFWLDAFVYVEPQLQKFAKQLFIYKVSLHAILLQIFTSLRHIICKIALNPPFKPIEMVYKLDKYFQLLEKQFRYDKQFWIKQQGYKFFLENYLSNRGPIFENFKGMYSNPHQLSSKFRT